MRVPVDILVTICGFLKLEELDLVHTAHLQGNYLDECARIYDAHLFSALVDELCAQVPVKNKVASYTLKEKVYFAYNATLCFVLPKGAEHRLLRWAVDNEPKVNPSLSSPRESLYPLCVPCCDRPAAYMKVCSNLKLACFAGALNYLIYYVENDILSGKKLAYNSDETQTITDLQVYIDNYYTYEEGSGKRIVDDILMLGATSGLNAYELLTVIWDNMPEESEECKKHEELDLFIENLKQTYSDLNKFIPRKYW